ncbi:MAG: type II secretion system F family protein [Candidatus Woesearchaeota archaeon]|nr:MAG: type II secretion system F family protein [Candidatus Woesearchaeota archaeon]
MNLENFQELVKKLSRNKKKLIGGGAAIIGGISALMYLLSISNTVIISFAVFATSFLFLIYFSVDYTLFLEIKQAERSYPDFLEDLAEAKSSGMTMAQSIKYCSGGEYGSLMPYILKLNTNVSWGMPFRQAWLKFTENVKQSRVMLRFNTIVLEAMESGADTASILSSLATRAGTIRSIEDSRKGVMRQQVVMMYIIFVGFIGIIILLKKILLPTLYIQNLGAEGFSQIVENVSITTLDAPYFKRLFMLIILAQSVSTGILIGQILEDKLIGGIKHIAILLGIGFMAFLIFINPVDVAVNQFISNTQPFKGEVISMGGTINVDGIPASNSNIEIKISGMEPINILTGTDGRFYTDLQVPSDTGPHLITIIIRYKDLTKVVREYINVQ